MAGVSRERGGADRIGGVIVASWRQYGGMARRSDIATARGINSVSSSSSIVSRVALSRICKRRSDGIGINNVVSITNVISALNVTRRNISTQHRARAFSRSSYRRLWRDDPICIIIERHRRRLSLLILASLKRNIA